MPVSQLQKRKHLGRGLEALVPISDRTKQVAEVEVSKIKTNPHQPRQHFSKPELNNLADSIRQHGILQPLLVKKTGETYILIAGERRLQAAKIAKLEKVPVVIRDVTQKELLEIAIIENVQRADLNPLEQAIAYQQLIDEFGLSQNDVAQRVGKNHSTISNNIRLLQLPQEIKKALVEETISEGHARALLGAQSTKALLTLFHKVIKEKLSVRDTERLVREENGEAETPSSKKEKKAKEILPANLMQFEKKLSKKINFPVSISLGKKGGKVTIKFKEFATIKELLEKL